MPTVRLVDLTAAIYGAEYCEPVVGNIVVWRDMQHLTATYAAALADQLAILAAFLTGSVTAKAATKAPTPRRLPLCMSVVPSCSLRKR